MSAPVDAFAFYATTNSGGVFTTRSSIEVPRMMTSVGVFASVLPLAKGSKLQPARKFRQLSSASASPKLPAFVTTEMSPKR